MLRFGDVREADVQGSTSGQFHVTMPANPAAIAAVTDGVAHVLAERHWAQNEIADVELALTEALANAVRHGCGGDATQYVRCRVRYEEPDEVVLVVRDPGPGFDPAAVPDPLDAANTLNPGGRGIFLMRRLMDHVQFADGGREVRMRKRKGSSG